jgi:FkbM family methyltransferase
MKHPTADRKTRDIIASGVAYQGDRLARALPLVRRRGLALDVGAHIGMWAVQLAAVFDRVHCFEPHPDSLAALRDNVAGLGVMVTGCALASRHGLACLESAGLGAHITASGLTSGTWVEMRRLDNFGFRDVDFIKIDVEGFETFVIQGGEETIRRDRPVIVLEQKHESRYGLARDAPVTILESWGATIEWKMKRDYCLRWK